MSKLLITGIGGGVGLHITKSLTEQGYMDIVGVDVNPETQARLKSESPIPLYASLAEAMAAEDIGGIYICTPDATHRDVAVEALTYGLPVLCEKPMGNRPEEAREMLEAAQASQGWLQIAFEYRFSPAFWRVHEIVESREVGAPLNVFNEYTPGPWGPNAPWRLDPAKNPGVFNEKLCHIVDLF
ncbi:MAG: Gfo/Idh/MocA family oxidoreductase, partial [candidate division WS1 bacterium]|nr:Gfo/Idh/MocA family oxidoreductase [candidate division WS1 bacterium]